MGIMQAHPQSLVEFIPPRQMPSSAIDDSLEKLANQLKTQGFALELLSPSVEVGFKFSNRNSPKTDLSTKIDSLVKRGEFEIEEPLYSPRTPIKGIPFMRMYLVSGGVARDNPAEDSQYPFLDDFARAVRKGIDLALPLSSNYSLPFAPFEHVVAKIKEGVQKELKNNQASQTLATRIALCGIARNERKNRVIGLTDGSRFYLVKTSENQDHEFYLGGLYSQVVGDSGSFLKSKVPGESISYLTLEKTASAIMAHHPRLSKEQIFHAVYLTLGYGVRETALAPITTTDLRRRYNGSTEICFPGVSKSSIFVDPRKLPPLLKGYLLKG